jgi:hypothetical protein
MEPDAGFGESLQYRKVAAQQQSYPVNPSLNFNKLPLTCIVDR